MYEAFYALKIDPFRLSPDHRLCYVHPSYKKARAYMDYALQRSEGFVMVTGRAGTGKTTLINDLLASLDTTRVRVAKLATSQMSGQDLLRSVAYAFDLSAEGVDQATLLRNIETLLIDEYESKRNVLLVVDEAQDLQESALTELRLLANIQRANHLLLQIFLVGQESLSALVRTSDMQQFHQRIIAACHLEPLNREQSRDYVLHRLSRAGWSGDPEIASGVHTLIHHFSQGVPRRINLICSRLFLHGCTEDKHKLSREDAEVVIEELRREKLTPASADDFPDLEPLPFRAMERLDAMEAARAATPAAAPPERSPVRAEPVAAPRSPQSTKTKTAGRAPCSGPRTVASEKVPQAAAPDPAAGLAKVVPERPDPQAHRPLAPKTDGGQPATDPTVAVTKPERRPSPASQTPEPARTGPVAPADNEALPETSHRGPPAGAPDAKATDTDGLALRADARPIRAPLRTARDTDTGGESSVSGIVLWTLASVVTATLFVGAYGYRTDRLDDWESMLRSWWQEKSRVFLGAAAANRLPAIIDTGDDNLRDEAELSRTQTVAPAVEAGPGQLAVTNDPANRRVELFLTRTET